MSAYIRNHRSPVNLVSLGILAASSALLLCAPRTYAQCELQKLTQIGTTAFGAALAIDHDVAVIGAPET